MAAAFPVVQGYLRKCGSGLPSEPASWRKRWFVLQDARLGVFKGSACTAPRFSLPVAGGGVHLEEDESGVESRISVLASDGQSLLLAAPSPAAAKRWSDALLAASSRAGRSEGAPEVENPAAAKRERTEEDSWLDDDCEESQTGGLPVLLVMEIEGGPCVGERFEIGEDGVTVLRKPTGIAAAHLKNLKQLQLPDADISRQHAEIRFKKGYFAMRDLGSLNGTTVNGERLSEEKKVSGWRPLAGGDKVVLGKKTTATVFFRVKVPDAPLPPEAREKKRRKEERRVQRDSRREERRAREEEDAARKGAAVSSKSEASAQAFLSDVLGMQRGGAGGGGQSRPNTAALGSIVEDVMDHNQRLDEEEREGANMRLRDLEHIRPRHQLPPSYVTIPSRFLFIFEY